MKRYYSNGKLLITGEYVVLDGALSLAVPTQFGQSLTVESHDESKIIWKSLDENNQVWFEDELKLHNTEMLKQVQHDKTSERLIQILQALKTLNPNFLDDKKGFQIETHLDFPRNWGLGTSSTLINNIAQWANVDAYQLLEKTFGGSGYDIACAQNNTAITYQIKNNKPTINPVKFNPSFKDHLYFVHLNKKQNSRDSIKHYRENVVDKASAIQQINDITLKMIHAESLETFEDLMYKHEVIISKITKQNTVKTLLFNDYEGIIKSLGAWGGDFVLATSKSNPSDYFKSKGYHTVIPYQNMIL